MAHPELLLTPLQPWAGAGGICSPPAPHAPKSCCPGLWQQWGQIPTGTLSNELKASSLLHREHHTLSFSKSKSVAESLFSPNFFFSYAKNQFLLCTAGTSTEVSHPIVPFPAQFLHFPGSVLDEVLPIPFFSIFFHIFGLWWPLWPGDMLWHSLPWLGTFPFHQTASRKPWEPQKLGQCCVHAFLWHPTSPFIYG